jgi:hypothetical protein
MKNILSILSALALAAAAQAGCGKTVTNEGTLKSYNADKKEVIITGKDGKDSKPITLTAKTKGADGVKELVGKAVKVESEHGKASSISKA